MLRFFSKVAFLTNLVFAIVFVMHWLKGIENWDPALVSNMVITAYFIATSTTILVNICTLVLLLRCKPVPVPQWLQLTNGLFLILQIIYFQYT